MLTSDLLRVKIVKNQIEPLFVDPGAARHTARAARMLDVFQHALADGWARGELEDEIEEIEGLSTDHKMVKGLAKVLLDRCEFSSRALPQEGAPDAAQIRARLFAASAAAGPLARRPGPTGQRTAANLLEEVAKEIGCTPQQLSDAMYADLKDEQSLIGADLPGTPEALLHRYNLSLAQSVLLRASRIVVRLHGPSPRRLRQLLRYIKFHQLMYRVGVERGSGRSTISLEVDGPASLLTQSSRYGLQLALFFPAVLLQECPWDLEAEVLWGGKRKFRKQLALSSASGLQSHYRDTGAWKSRAEEWFEQRFAELASSWTLQPGEILDLGGQQLLVPDFTFRRRGRTAHLDIVGFWRKGYLEKRLESTPSNVLFAVSKRLAGEKARLPERLQGQVVEFAEIIPAKEVLARLEMIALPRTEAAADWGDEAATVPTQQTGMWGEVPAEAEPVEEKPAKKARKPRATSEEAAKTPRKPRAKKAAPEA